MDELDIVLHAVVVAAEIATFHELVEGLIFLTRNVHLVDEDQDVLFRRREFHDILQMQDLTAHELREP